MELLIAAAFTWGPWTIEHETLGRFLFALWIVAFGGCVGSFLNVVIYRLPAGKHLVYPGSRCPRCDHAIRWYDNIPVLSWLILRARCRDCHTAIPARYPSVEAAVALMFLLLFLVEGNSGGANLPMTWWRRMEFGIGWQSLGITAYHLLLLCTLFCSTLIRYDGHPVPLRMIAFTIAVGLVASVIWPELHPVPLHVGLRMPGWLLSPLEGIVGGAVGLVIGWCHERSLSPLHRRWRRRYGMSAELAAVGVFLGAQAVLVIGPVAWLAGNLSWRSRGRFPPLRLIPRAAWGLAGSFGYIVCWKFLTNWVLPLSGRWP